MKQADCERSSPQLLHLLKTPKGFWLLREAEQMISSGGPEQLEPAEIQQLHSQSTVTVTGALMKAKFLLVHWRL